MADERDDDLEGGEEENPKPAPKPEPKPKPKPAPKPERRDADEEEGEDEGPAAATIRKIREERDGFKRQLMEEKRLREQKEREAEDQRVKELPEVERAKAENRRLEKEKSDAEKATAALKARIAEKSKRAAVEREAAREGPNKFGDPRVAARLADLNNLDYDEDTDEVTGTADEIKKILKDFPALAATQTQHRPGTAPPPGGPKGRRNGDEEARQIPIGIDLENHIGSYD
jgi:hypothetical protein